MEEAPPDALEEVERVEPRPQELRQLPVHHQADLRLIPRQQLARRGLVPLPDPVQDLAEVPAPLLRRLTVGHGTHPFPGSSSPTPNSFSAHLVENPSPPRPIRSGIVAKGKIPRRTSADVGRGRPVRHVGREIAPGCMRAVREPVRRAPRDLRGGTAIASVRSRHGRRRGGDPAATLGPPGATASAVADRTRVSPLGSVGAAISAVVNRTSASTLGCPEKRGEVFAGLPRSPFFMISECRHAWRHDTCSESLPFLDRGAAKQRGGSLGGMAGVSSRLRDPRVEAVRQCWDGDPSPRDRPV